MGVLDALLGTGSLGYNCVRKDGELEELTDWPGWELLNSGDRNEHFISGQNMLPGMG